MPSAMSETAVPTLRRPLRVLFVLPDLDGGGAQRVTLSLLRHLDAARYAISLLVLNGPGALVSANKGVGAEGDWFSCRDTRLASEAYVSRTEK